LRIKNFKKIDKNELTQISSKQNKNL